MSGALWIPLIWLMILGSRPVAQWLNEGPVLEREMDIISGNPIDRTIFIILIIIGIFVLSRRDIYYSNILKSNAWIILLFSYCGISIFWSDFPFVSFKRWIREIGNLIMVLVVLTDPNPGEAVRTVIRRCAYFLIPLSVVLIKYYPDLGRTYGPWSGEAELIGVATSKNMLGNLCVVCGIFFFWDFLTIWRKKNVFIDVLFLLTTFWLLIKANSATSLLCFIVGGCILMGMGFPIIKRNVKFIGFLILIAVVVFLMLQLSIDLVSLLISALGRDTTLTGRAELWKTVVSMVANPLIGSGYESFWLGGRLTKLWEIFWWRPNQAHNGFIETYLNLGLIGLFLLTGVIFSSYRNIRRTLMVDFDSGRLRMVFLVVALLVNGTESVFKGTSIVWFALLLVAMEVWRASQFKIRESSVGCDFVGGI